MSLVFGSVCSGMEAASVAWLPLGWRCAFMSEIDPHARAVLQHHYPDTPPAWRLHDDRSGTVRANRRSRWRHPNAGGQVGVLTHRVRRLTPTECLRLQGSPDAYFDGVLYRGAPLADGPRYRLLGNSFAVPVVRWIGKRIMLADRATNIPIDQ